MTSKVERIPMPPVDIEGDHSAYRFGECAVIVGIEPAGKGGRILWHLSISCADRYPTWDEIRDAKYRFTPEYLTMAMLLPPKDQYVNIHPNCFHLWEVDDLRADDAKV